MSTPVARKGFFTDTTVCIGCKACEVACKQWNQLPDDGMFMTGMSYDNTVDLGASTWRHVAFVEKPAALRGDDDAAFSWPATDEPSPAGTHFRLHAALAAVATNVLLGVAMTAMRRRTRSAISAGS